MVSIQRVWAMSNRYIACSGRLGEVQGAPYKYSGRGGWSVIGVHGLGKPRGLA